MQRRARRAELSALVAAVVLALIGASPGVATAARNRAPEQARGLIVGDGPTQLGITGTPRFSWQVVDRDPNEVQTAYRIIVASEPTVLRQFDDLQRVDVDDSSIVWDSGRVESGEQTYVEYAGPALPADTSWYWTVQTFDESGKGGKFAEAQRFDTGLGDADWEASWIRRGSFTASGATPEDYSYARKDVVLGASPITRAVAYTSASHHYELWINGTRVDQGPSFSYPDKQYYQSTDVADALRAGAPNAIGLLYHWYGKGQGRPLAAPGAITQISIEHEDGSHELVFTDGSWRVLAGPWLAAPLRNDEGDFVEHIDGTREPVGWADPGFDASAWDAATVVGQHPTAPWTHLVSQEPRIVEEPITPVSVKHLKSGAYVADYGKVYAAVPTVAFVDGAADRKIALRVGYLLDPDGQVSTTLGVQDTDLSYEYTQRDGMQTFRPLNYMGFRYLQVDDPGEVLTPAALTAYARHTAVPDEHGATFASSNKTLDAIWELARHTALYGSQEQFVDTPTREKGQFLGDAYYSAISDQRAFGERALSSQALHEFLSSQARYWPDGRVNAAEPTGEGARDIPDGTTAFPEWVWRAYLDTGDRELLATAYPVLTNLSDYIARYIDPETGLVTRLEGGGTDYRFGIVDYPVNMRYGYDMVTAARTTINMTSVDAFRRATDVACALDRPDAEVQAQEDRADALVTAINTQLRRKDGVYIDGLEPNGVQSKHASQHANAYALSYGVVPDDDVKKVAAFTAGLGMKMGPGTVYDLLLGLDVGGRDPDLVRILTDKTEPGYAQVLAKGGTFVWETWVPVDVLGDGMSHTRGAIVLAALQENLLGVRVQDPGWSTFEVIPPTGGLDNASGVVPTPRGAIRVSWERDDDGNLTVRLHVPVNSQAVVRLPGHTETVGSGTHVVTSDD